MEWKLVIEPPEVRQDIVSFSEERDLRYGYPLTTAFVPVAHECAKTEIDGFFSDILDLCSETDRFSHETDKDVIQNRIDNIDKEKSRVLEFVDDLTRSNPDQEKANAFDSKPPSSEIQDPRFPCDSCKVYYGIHSRLQISTSFLLEAFASRGL